MNGISSASSVGSSGQSPAKIDDLKQLKATGFHFDGKTGIEWNSWLDAASKSKDPTLKAQYKELIDIAGGKTDRPSLLQAMEVAQAYLAATGPKATASDKQALMRTMENNLNFQFGRLSPTELLSAPLRQAGDALLKNPVFAGTEWGQALQNVMTADRAVQSFGQGVAEGIWQGGKDMVVGIVSMAGKALQYGADNSVSGYAGDALRGLTGKMPGWLEAIVPSAKRGAASSEVLGKAMSGAANYLSTHSPGQIADDIGKAIGNAWEGLKADHAKAAAQGPEAEARWWGQTIGRVGFEVAATFIPVAGVAGKLSKTAKGADLVTDGMRTTDKVNDLGRVGATGGKEIVESLLTRAKKILGDLPLNSKSLDDLYQAGKMTMDEARALAKDVGWKSADDKWIYPPNEGVDGAARAIEIANGSKIDRYGGRIDARSGEFVDTGRYTSPAGTDYSARALPPGTEKGFYKTYEVLKPIPSEAGKATPWFGETGGGLQFKTDMNIEQLINGDFIREIK